MTRVGGGSVVENAAEMDDKGRRPEWRKKSNLLINDLSILQKYAMSVQGISGGCIQEQAAVSNCFG